MKFSRRWRQINRDAQNFEDAHKLVEMNGRLAILHIAKKPYADIGHLRQLYLRRALPLSLLLNDYGNLGHGIYSHCACQVFYHIRRRSVNPFGLIFPDSVTFGRGGFRCDSKR